ncbi:MAG: DUF2610 domain-containing protein, partial [Terriglobia bacterium]
YSLINIDPAPSDSLPLDERIELLQQAITLQQAYATSLHKNWWLTSQPLLSQEALARALLQKGDKEGAFQVAKDAATHGGTKAMKLLAHWYETGAGPVTVDKKEKERWQAEAKRRDHNDGYKMFTVPMTFTYSSENLPWNFSIRDPVDGDDPVEEEIDRLEYWEGAILADDVKDSFRKLLKIAQDNNVSFEELAAYALQSTDKYARDPGDFLVKLSCAFDGKSPVPDKPCALAKGLDNILAVIEETSKREGAESILKDGFAKAAAESRLRDFVQDIGDKASDKQLWPVARWAFDTVLSTDSGQYELLAKRGRVLQAMGLFKEAEADYFKLLTFRRNDPHALKHLAYLWIEQDRELNPALELLNRATKLAPESPDIRDSIGWAYVKLGDIDQALSHLDAARKGDPKQAEISGSSGQFVGRCEPVRAWVPVDLWITSLLPTGSTGQAGDLWTTSL